jgi:quinol monooxygenase YgiN
MLIYQLEINIKPYKLDEFVISMRSIMSSIRKQKGCLDVSGYQNSEKKNTYMVIGEWETRPAMERHFKTYEFELLIGAARVLGETFTVNICENSRKENFVMKQFFPSVRNSKIRSINS